MQRISTLRVSSLCLGGNVFGWTADVPTSEAILDGYIAGGGNFIDTADTYSIWVPGHSGGESERVIGNWLRNRKHKVVLATKVGRHPQRRGLRPSNLRVCLDGSRRRLGLETIDLYYAHTDDPNLPAAEWLGAFNDMIQEGLIRHYGLSNFTADRVRELCDIARANDLALPVALQPEYSLAHRTEVEGGLAEAAAENGLAIIPHSSLAAGFLTGKYVRDEPLHGPRAGSVKHYATEAGFRTLDALVALADSLDLDPSTVALAWLRQSPAVVAPTASVSTVEQLPALLQAMTLRLTKPQLNKLSKASAV
ncbi:MAG: aldo/keto reductase [Propionibacteriaceae bacterium]|jgi:aryl-alcohol dehydrogenase-like predicted oxidoreductase|nr:aldo/keto reductase [Propionibacteriaceae bacterium]